MNADQARPAAKPLRIRYEAERCVLDFVYFWCLFWPSCGWDELQIELSLCGQEVGRGLSLWQPALMCRRLLGLNNHPSKRLLHISILTLMNHLKDNMACTTMRLGSRGVAKNHPSKVSNTNTSKGCFAAIARSFRPTPTPLKLAGRWGVSTVLPRRHQHFWRCWTLNLPEQTLHTTHTQTWYTAELCISFKQWTIMYVFVGLDRCNLKCGYRSQLNPPRDFTLFVRQALEFCYKKVTELETEVRIVQAASSYHFTVVPWSLKLHAVHDSNCTLSKEVYSNTILGSKRFPFSRKQALNFHDYTNFKEDYSPALH